MVNPQATSTTAAGRDVLAHALASDVKLEVLETSYRGHAADAAAQAAADGVDLVVAHGGDGTVNEVVNGLMRADGIGAAARPMLGVVPGGSANVFAGALGLPRDPVEATYHLLQAIEAGRSRRIGFGRLDDRWFTFNAGVGWDAEVVAAVDRRRSKQASPVLYARKALAHYVDRCAPAPELTVELPGEELVSGIRLVMVCNADPWTYLGSRSRCAWSRSARSTEDWACSRWTPSPRPPCCDTSAARPGRGAPEGETPRPARRSFTHSGDFCQTSACSGRRRRAGRADECKLQVSARRTQGRSVTCRVTWPRPLRDL